MINCVSDGRGGCVAGRLFDGDRRTSSGIELNRGK